MTDQNNEKKKDRSLKNKAVNIKGKLYVQVADRIVFFNETYTNGLILTELLSPLESTHIVFRATVIPDYKVPERKFNAYSQATVGEGLVNKTSALENAETSAVGRALAMMGIGVIESIASSDEINKSNNQLKTSINNNLPKCPVCESKLSKNKTSGELYCYTCWKKSKEKPQQEPVIDVDDVPPPIPNF